MVDEQVGEHVVTLAVGNDDFNASLVYLASNVVLRLHSSASRLRFLRLDITTDVVTLLHTPNQFRTLILGVAREDTIDVREDDEVVCGNGSACVIGFQGAVIKKHTRLFTNSGCAAMGYGFPASIGACVSRGGKRTICIDGDGSFQMNLQELQTVVYNKLNLKIIYPA